jgi:hypothetical protein
VRAAIFEGPGNVRVEQVPDAELVEATDAVVAVTHAAICGSDLWSYRGYGQRPAGSSIGHEFLGVVQSVGHEVHNLHPGDLVVAPHIWSDGTCDYCRSGLHSSCVDGGMWGTPGHDGAHGEAVRVPNADGTLVLVPAELRDEPERVLPVAEVMAAGQHAARVAGVGYGKTVAVVGDGAVGLCAVLAASRSGADQIIAIGRHADRLDVAKRFGATELVTAGHGNEAIEEVLSLTGGVDAVLECVGSQSALDTAIAVARDGATIGYVGAPHMVDGLDMGAIFCRNISVRGGVCPSRAYLPQLLSAVASGTLDPSPIFDRRVSLEDIATGYQAMDRRDSLKVLVEVAR